MKEVRGQEETEALQEEKRQLKLNESAGITNKQGYFMLVMLNTVRFVFQVTQ